MILFVGDLDRADRDREGFQEIDMAAFFAPIAKWAARIDDARRIPEYVARAYRVATAGRPGPVVLAIPEDMLRDDGRGARPPARPAGRRNPRPRRDRGDDRIAQGSDQLRWRSSAAPTGARAPAHHWANFAFRHGIPTAAAFRRQDAVDNRCGVYAGQLGYGPNPKLQQRVRDADLLLVIGARLGESTTDGYKLVTPDHPGQTDRPRPPRPQRAWPRLSRRSADLRRHERVRANGRRVERSRTDPLRSRRASASRMARMERTRTARRCRRRAVKLDLGPCVKAMRDALPVNTIICNGAGNFSGWWHRYWRYGPAPTQLAPTSGTMGYGLPAAVAAALRFKDRTVVCVAGDGDFLMNGQELATAAQYGADLLVILVDNGAYGTIRMHQERDYPERISATDPRQSRFRQACRGLWRRGRAGRGDRPVRPRACSVDGARGHPVDPLRHRCRVDLAIRRRSQSFGHDKGAATIARQRPFEPENLAPAAAAAPVGVVNKGNSVSVTSVK